MKRVGFLFPGQGSQQVGMGLDLSEAFPESRSVFEEADAALGDRISSLCFEGPEHELALTQNTQPAILTTSVAALRALAAGGIYPDAAAGHSLGEYSAHVAAGTLDFADAVRTVRARGRFMQEAVPVGKGAMAAIIGLELARVESICEVAADDEIVSPANLNSPGQVVIAGNAGAVDRAVAAAEGAGATKAVKLQVSAPFHCALMQPAELKLRPVLESLKFEDPAVPVYANLDGAPVSGAGAAREALVRQVTSPVQWQAVMERMLDDGIEALLEVGPGKVLGGLARRIRKGTRVISVADREGVERAIRDLGGES